MNTARIAPKTPEGILKNLKKNIEKLEDNFGKNKLIDDFKLMHEQLTLASSQTFNLVKKIEHLQAAKIITDFFFDKEGHVVKNRPELNDPIFLNLLYAYKKYCEDMIIFIASQSSFTLTAAKRLIEIPPYKERANSIDAILKDYKFHSLLEDSVEAKAETIVRMSPSGT